MARTPEVKSFLVADMVIQEKVTNKWSVVGIFDQVLAPKFPTARSGVGLYVKLADAEGRYKVRIEFRDSEDTVLAKMEGLELTTNGPVRTLDFGVPIQFLHLPKPGTYHFQLFLNDELAQMAALHAVQAMSPPG